MSSTFFQEEAKILPSSVMHLVMNNPMSFQNTSPYYAANRLSFVYVWLHHIIAIACWINSKNRSSRSV